VSDAVLCEVLVMKLPTIKVDNFTAADNAMRRFFISSNECNRFCNAASISTGEDKNIMQLFCSSVGFKFVRLNRKKKGHITVRIVLIVLKS